MNWVEWLLHHKLTVILSTIALILVGLFSLFFIALSPFQAIHFNEIIVSVSYPGANAQAVKNQVTDKLDALKSIPNVISMNATSAMGVSNIRLTLDSNQPNDVLQTQIDIAKVILDSDLPIAVSSPRIEVASTMSPLTKYFITSDQLSPFEVDNYVKANLFAPMSLPGVIIRSYNDPAVLRIALQPEKLAQYGVNISSLGGRINQAIQQQPLGSLYIDKQPFLLNQGNAIDTLPELKNLLIGYTSGASASSAPRQPVFLKDIANIQYGSRYPLTRSYSSYNGHPSALMQLQASTDINPFEIYQKTDRILQRLSTSFPADLSVHLVFNMAAMMKDAFNDVVGTMFIAALLVIVIAWVFLGRLRTTLMPVITVPVCLLGTVAVITALGMTLNIFTLLAFVIAIGLVVDDAIVVVENITCYMEQGMRRLDATILGTRKIAQTVIGITATLLVVYLPLTFCEGSFITFLSAFAIPLAVAVFFSGVLALTLTPIMCQYLLPTSPLTRYQLAFNARLQRFIHHYQRVLKRVIQRPLWSLLVTAVLLGVGVFYSMQVPHNFFPNDPSGDITVEVDGGSNDDVSSIKAQLTAITQYDVSKKSSSQIMRIMTDASTGELTGELSLHYQDRYLHQLKSMTDEMNAQLKSKHLDNIFASFTKVNNSGGGDDVSVMLYGGTDVVDVNEKAKIITDLMKESPLFTNANNTINQPAKQLVFDIDGVSAARVGLYETDINQLLSTYFNGYQMTTDFNIDGLTVPVVMQLNDDALMDSDILQRLTITSPLDQTVYPLSSFVQLKMVSKPTIISTYNGYPSVTLNGHLADGVSLSDAIPYINQLLKANASTFSYEYQGNAKIYIEGNTQTILIALLGIAFIYFFLAVLFKSLLDPLIILLTVPFSIVSGILSLYITGDTVNLYSTLALLTLIGLITKHGILIVQFANQSLEKEMSVIEAVMASTHDRFRPIIMTTLAMTLGALPLLLSQNIMYVSRRDIGLVLIVGLLVGTVFSLFIIPLVYTLIKKVEGSR